MELLGYVITVMILIVCAALTIAKDCKDLRFFNFDRSYVANITTKDGGIELDGFKYPPGSFLTEDYRDYGNDRTFIVACPCMPQQCIHNCSSKLN